MLWCEGVRFGYDLERSSKKLGVTTEILLIGGTGSVTVKMQG